MSKESWSKNHHLFRNLAIGLTTIGLALAGSRILSETNPNQTGQKSEVSKTNNLPVFTNKAAKVELPANSIVSDFKTNEKPKEDNAQDWGNSPFASVGKSSFPAPQKVQEKNEKTKKLKDGWQTFLSTPFGETEQQIKIDLPPEFYQTVPAAQIDAFGNKIAASFKSARIGEDSNEIVIAYNPVVLLTQINEYTNEYLKKTKKIDPNAKIIEEVENTLGERILIIRYGSNKNQKPWLEREIFIALPQGFNSGLSISFTTTPMFSEKQAMFFEIAKSFL